MNRIVVLFIVATGVGCALIPIIPDRQSKSLAHHVGPYWGPECQRDPVNAHESYGEQADAGKQPNLAHAPADQILRLVCNERILGGYAEPDKNTWVVQHFRFDELAFDHWTAAMMMVQCLEAQSCLDVHAGPYKRSSGRPVASYYQVAMMRWYAEHVDRAQVATRLRQLALPPAAQQTYLALLDQARNAILADSDQLPPEIKRLFVELPAQVHARRDSERAAAANVIAELATLAERQRAELASGKVSDATVEALRKLRVAYHASCRKDCTGDAVFGAISKLLLFAYVSRNDAASAVAEAKVLQQLAPTAAEEIAKAQYDVIKAAAHRAGEASRVREQGIDPTVARASAGGTAIELGDDSSYVYRPTNETRVAWMALVPDGNAFRSFEGTVASIELRGDRALVRFADRVHSFEENVGCHETNRIDSIDRDGGIHYREVCTGTATRTAHQKVEPIELPAAEAAGLQGGDNLVGYARPGADAGHRSGSVWQVKRGDRVARLRDVWL